MGVARVSETGCNHHAETSGVISRDAAPPGIEFCVGATQVIASVLITSWQIDGETMETVTDLIFLGFKITVDDDCSHEIKRHFLLAS